MNAPLAFSQPRTAIISGGASGIASACAFLVREDAGYLTGQIIGVNGGRIR
jgi:NAD(P)-dependent dehydrogenase (short-subunit alcohol dehydrogenase family)